MLNLDDDDAGRASLAWLTMSFFPNAHCYDLISERVARLRCDERRTHGTSDRAVKS